MMDQLAAAIHALPEGMSGEFREGDRILSLSRTKGAVELRLGMKQAHAEPLLDAAIDVPADGSGARARSLRRHSNGAFTRRDEKYLGAMVAWATRILSTVPAPELLQRTARPRWKAVVRKFVAAASNGSAATARRFLEREADSLDDLEDEEIAVSAIEFLRDEDVLIQLDWKEEDEFTPRCLERIERLGLHEVARVLGGNASGASFEEQVQTMARCLEAAGYALLDIDEGSDAYHFVICSESNATVAVDSLGKLGVSAKRVGRP